MVQHTKNHTTSMTMALASAIVLAAGCAQGAEQDRPVADAPEGARIESSATGGRGVSSSGFAAVKKATQGAERTRFGWAKLWEDGKAEVVKYDATRMRYGKRRYFELTMIHVKEEFNPKQLIKSDAPSSRDLQVIKTNIVFEMPTDNYPYNMAANVFTTRENPFQVVKMTSTSHEWCGTTTKKLDLRGDDVAVRYDSYFESEGDGVFELEWPKNGVLEEQLFFAVRALPFAEGFSMPISVLSRQQTSHADRPRWRKGTLEVTGKETVTDAVGTQHETWRVVADVRGQELVYHVGAASPHRLVRFTSPDGFTLTMREAVRWAYWGYSPSPFTK